MKMCKNTDNDRFLSMFSPNVKATLEKHSIGVPPSLSYIPKQYNDASTSTDLCSSDVDEVEIFSLIEEQIPKYKVRACKITNFSGTSNQDFEFVKFPALNVPENIGLGLTSDTIRETLNYFLLSGKRCSEMTTCYDDIEAVTRLLQEKEKDLELTVHIGKELLSQNTQLEKRIIELEAELRNANESVAQLSHELIQKTELINILTDSEEVLSENASPSSSKAINIELIQRKINVLESENKKLHTEVLQIQSEAEEVEEHERKLFQDLSEQLNLTNNQYESINLELERYKEENRLQSEQINNLTQRLHDAEIRLHELLTENDECYITLTVTKENQNLLATELSECKSRYQETLTLLQETQLLLREKQRRSQPQSNRSSLYVPGMQYMPQYNPESLHTELMESSMFSENSSLDSGINSDSGQNKHIPQFQKVFDTVKCASSNSNTYGFGDSLGSELNIISSQPRMSCSIYSADSTTKPNEKAASFSMYSSIYGSQKNEDAVSSVSDDYNSQKQYGMMGCPGAKDLETALKNLSSAEITKRRTELSYGSFNYEHETAQTPESLFSNMSGSTGSSLSHYRYPKKLEIVKPMEGSSTLNQWKGLATPTLDGLLYDNERVKVRGEKGLDEFGLQIYSLGDVEEDVEDLPSLKHFDPSPCIYTYTDSKVLHPDDGASITFSLPPSRMSTAPPTPRLGLSRRNSCSTFSVSNGLASMLNERGIHAVTPSCLNTPLGPNFSPTVTPCNSPECQSPTLEHQEAQSISITSFLTSSAGLLKKKITRQKSNNSSSSNNNSNRNSQQSDKAAIILEQKVKQRTINILKEVETLGIENVLPAAAPSTSLSSTSRIINKPLAIHSSNIYTTRYNSPMTQLTSLKHLSEQRRVSENSSESDKSAISSANNNNSSKGSPENRVKQKLQRHKTRRNLNAIQRPDLGTVNGTKAADKSKDTQQKPGLVGGFVGSISSIFFGRKGGFL